MAGTIVSGTNGFTINAGVNDVVTLRNLVINGIEVGGGSMRIHEHALQTHVFSTLGLGGEATTHFAPLLEALEMGAPPHGGMALGVERLLACLLGLPHIRSTMAFPKTAGGQCLLTQALS